MSKKEKLIRRFQSRPVDFTFDELISLLTIFGYSIEAAGKTSGSRVTFSNENGDYLRLHKPHPRNVLKMYQIDDILSTLKEKGLL
ncbi:MAG: type II toxin-antitoxin system HicA family toxin [Treponema sp.]|nr:type II toxin-antitoxin system HicA family toxin [Treponema sp.]MCL2251380.1 type II toxin-antitoxin system HicA family toxin [Treponema sp.]